MTFGVHHATSLADLGSRVVIGGRTAALRIDDPGGCPVNAANPVWAEWLAARARDDRFGACERVPGYPGPRPASQELSSAFFRGLWQKAEEWRSKGLQAGPEIFLNVWTNESGIRSDTSACNPPWNNAGLNGMGEQERQNVGFHDGFDAWVSLTPEEQLPYVLRFFEANVGSRGWANIDRAGTLYLLNFLPRYFGHRNEPGYILAAESIPNGDNHPSSQAWYRANKGLDFGNKGYIEVADMDRAMANAANLSVYKNAVKRLYAEGPTSGPLPPPAGSPTTAASASSRRWLWVAGVLALAGGAAYAAREAGVLPRLPRLPEMPSVRVPTGLARWWRASLRETRSTFG